MTTQNQSTDRTKAPSPLPEVLPAGTEWERYDGYRFRFNVGAKLRYGCYYATGNYERLKPNPGPIDYPPGSRGFSPTDPALIDWPSYHRALAAQAKANEFKVGDRVIYRFENVPVEESGVVVAVRGDRYDIRNAEGSTATGWTAAFMRHEPAPVAEVKAEDRLYESGCCLCGATSHYMRRDGREYCNTCYRGHDRITDAVYAEMDRRLALQKPASGSPVKPSAPGTPDPYAVPTPDDGFLEWSSKQDRIAAAKAKHLADLDRPLKTGPLKNRDRWGQLLSARGWETSEDEP